MGKEGVDEEVQECLHELTLAGRLDTGRPTPKIKKDESGDLKAEN